MLVHVHALINRGLVNPPQNSIAAINTTINNEPPEALLEALVQVAVCKDVIGWRVAARKLVLVMTDAGFHVAGDGRVNCYNYTPKVVYVVLPIMLFNLL